jgi:branched-chain amino acid transport system permease protein
VQLFFQDLVNGVLAGGILAVAALGFSLVWGILNIINLAHGAFVMVGAYIAWQLFSSFHLDPFLSVPIAFALMFVFGYGLQRGLINQVIRAPLLATFLLTFGLALLIVNLAQVVWTSDTRAVTPSYSGSNFTVLAVTIPWTKVATLGAALGITALVNLWLTRSRMGRAIRAMAMDVGAAQLMGVQVAHVYAVTFGLGAA